MLPVRGASCQSPLYHSTSLWPQSPPAAWQSEHGRGGSLGEDYSITVILHRLLFDCSLNFPLSYKRSLPLSIFPSLPHLLSLSFSHCSALAGRLAFFISPPSPHRPFSILLVLLQRSPPPSPRPSILPFSHTPCLSLWRGGVEKEKGPVIKDKDESKQRETNTDTNKPLSCFFLHSHSGNASDREPQLRGWEAKIFVGGCGVQRIDLWVLTESEAPTITAQTGDKRSLIVILAFQILKTGMTGVIPVRRTRSS